MLISFEAIHLYISLTILAVVLAMVWISCKNLFHLFFCAIFGVYLIGAISIVIFPFFKVTDGSNPDFLRNLNLIPFNFGTCFDDLPEPCIRNIFENILLTIPFGFGIRFIAQVRPKHIPWLILAIGFSFENAQLIMALIFHISFRTIDINDVILNATGAFIGYLLFKLFGWLYLLIIQKLNLQPKRIFAYVHEIVTPHFG